MNGSVRDWQSSLFRGRGQLCIRRRSCDAPQKCSLPVVILRLVFPPELHYFVTLGLYADCQCFKSGMGFIKVKNLIGKFIYLSSLPLEFVKWVLILSLRQFGFIFILCIFRTFVHLVLSLNWRSCFSIHRYLTYI